MTLDDFGGWAPLDSHWNKGTVASEEPARPPGPRVKRPPFCETQCRWGMVGRIDWKESREQLEEWQGPLVHWIKALCKLQVLWNSYQLVLVLKGVLKMNHEIYWNSSYIVFAGCKSDSMLPAFYATEMAHGYVLRFSSILEQRRGKSFVSFVCFGRSIFETVPDFLFRTWRVWFFQMLHQKKISWPGMSWLPFNFTSDH